MFCYDNEVKMGNNNLYSSNLHTTNHFCLVTAKLLDLIDGEGNWFKFKLLIYRFPFNSALNKF